jgi:hypothetical protein
MKTTLLAAVAAVGLGIGPAFAADSNSGYAYPDFWGTDAAQQAPAANVPAQANSATVGTYATQSSQEGTWLFPPSPNGDGTSD